MAKVIFNNGSLDTLLRSAAIEQVLRSHAEPVAAAARASAPVVTGTYRDSIEVVADQHATRVVVHVVARARHAHLVEARTGNLARSLGSA